MRMWLINPKQMCRKHLLGEHVEMHMFKGTIEGGKSINGYLKNGLVDLGKIKKRHDELVIEMKKRGYKHNSPMINFNEGKIYSVIKEKNIKELCKRCKECKKLLK